MRISDWSSDVCSSDLAIRLNLRLGGGLGVDRLLIAEQEGRAAIDHQEHDDRIERLREGEPAVRCFDGAQRRDHRIHRHLRSEEHTSELQSLMRISYAVLCWKKKTQRLNNQIV